MDAIWQFEIGINIFFQHLGTWLLLPMKGISLLGQAGFFLLVMPAFYWCIDSRNGLRLGLMLLVTSSVNGLLKLAFHHPRPYWLDNRVAALETENSFGMPSGHSQNAMAMWGYISRIYRKYKWLLPTAAGVIILTGISRIYLGVHFPDQVLVGWLIGALLVWGLYRFEAGILRLANKLSLVQLILVILVISLGIVGLSFLFIAAIGPVPPSWQAAALAAAPEAPFNPQDSSDNVMLAGVCLGLAGGAAYDWRKHGQLPTGGPLSQKIIRYLLGLVGLAVIYLGLKLVLPDTTDFLGTTLRYFQYTLVGLWVTLFAPSFFRRLRLV